MLLLLGAMLLGAAAFMAAEARTAAQRQRRELVKTAATYGAVALPGVHGASVRERSFLPLVTWAANVVYRLLPRTTRASTTQRLIQAGIANRISADELIAAKGLVGGLGAFLGIVVGVAAGGSAGIVIALALGVIGFIGPDMIVNSRIRSRRERIHAALPDALDLLAVTVEAGLGFDGALTKLTEHSEGPLREEFALALNEMRIGEGRVEALKRMAGRIAVPEVSTFIRAVVQADQLGMSIAGMLRAQAGDARVRRQLAAEEKAMKAPIKMIFPMVFLIMPSLFIVILGPFFLDFGKNF